MGLFSKKEGIDVLDLPELQRRGLLKFPEPPRPGDDLLDLTKTQPSVTTPIAQPFSQPANNNEMSCVSDFLNDVDRAIVTSNIQKSYAVPSHSTREGFFDFSAIGTVAPNNALVAGIKNGTDDLTWRIENTEYKIEQLLAKIAELEKKVSDKTL